jgi:hypothetical protein
MEEFNEAKRRPGRLQAERVRFVDVAARYLVAYKTKRDGTPRPKSSLAKERSCLNIYILPVLGDAWIGDLDLSDLNETVRGLTLQDGTPASGGTKSTVAAVLRRLFAWAREERIIPANPVLELRTGWGSSVRLRVLIPSIPQVMRLAEALDYFKKGLGDVAMLMAFTGPPLGRSRSRTCGKRRPRRPVDHGRPDGQRIRRQARRPRRSQDARRRTYRRHPRHRDACRAAARRQGHGRA